MILLDIAVIVVCFFVLLSEKINTNILFCYLGVGLMIMGALINYADRCNVFMEIGVLLFFAHKIYMAHNNKQKRRLTDYQHTKYW